MLVETNGKKILVDPGVYSWQDNNVKTTDLSGISVVVVTHSHPDHLNNDFVTAIKQASPNANWFGTGQVAEQLKGLGIECMTGSEDEDVKYIESTHADLSPWFAEQPEHTSFLLFNELLVTGDCQTLTSTHGARVIAGAINGGPWGAVVGFCKMIESMDERPEVVVPLHDWHWNQTARDAIYERLPQVMGQFGVNFIPLEICSSKEV